MYIFSAFERSRSPAPHHGGIEAAQTKTTSHNRYVSNMILEVIINNTHKDFLKSWFKIQHRIFYCFSLAWEHKPHLTPRQRADFAIQHWTLCTLLSSGQLVAFCEWHICGVVSHCTSTLNTSCAGILDYHLEYYSGQLTVTVRLKWYTRLEV